MGREETITLYTPARVPGGTGNTIAREGQVKEGVKLPLCSQVRRCPPRWDLARLTPGGTGVRAALCLSQTAGSLRVPARLAGHTGQRDQGTGEEAQPQGTLSVHKDVVVCTHCSLLQARCCPPHLLLSKLLDAACTYFSRSGSHPAAHQPWRALVRLRGAPPAP